MNEFLSDQGKINTPDGVAATRASLPVFDSDMAYQASDGHQGMEIFDDFDVSDGFLILYTLS